MSLAENVTLSAYSEANQSYHFCVFAFSFLHNKNIVEELYYEGHTREKSHEQA